MSTKAEDSETANRLTVLFVNSNKLAPGLYGDGNSLFLRSAVRQPVMGLQVSRTRRQPHTRDGAWHGRT